MGWLVFDLDDVDPKLTPADIAAYKLSFVDALGTTWKAQISPTQSEKWLRNQKWWSPNVMDLATSAGARVEIQRVGSSEEPS